MTLKAFFAGRPVAARISAMVCAAVLRVELVDVRATRSQISFRRRRGFAWVWTPDRYLRGNPAPLVLSIALPRRDPSLRWKTVVEPGPGRFMHHLELRSAREVDDEVAGWLREAWEDAA